MHRPSFTVATFVVVALTCLAVLTRLLAPRIPAPAPNRLAQSEDPYVRQARFQAIDWYPYGPKPFTLARRDGKPILLVIGAPWSATARQMDHAAFPDKEVVNYLRRNFVSVRVDGNAHPEWLNAFLPVQRLQLRFAVGFQVWILDPQGRLLDFFGRFDALIPDKTTFLQALIQAKRHFEALQEGRDSSTPPGQAQAEDAQIIAQSPSRALPEFLTAYENISRQAGVRNGGFPLRGIQTWFPGSWRFLASIGRIGDVRATLDPLLRTPMVDLVDGGFFRSSSRLDGLAPDYDKTAVQNAEMISLLSGLEANGEDPVYRLLADHAFDWLIAPGRPLPMCRTGDELRSGRSAHSSFSPEQLRSILDSADRDWAEDNLGLRPFSNPRMTPFLATRLAERDRKTRSRILQSLRLNAKTREPLVMGRRLSTEGFVLARLIEAARRRSDARRLKTTLDLADNLTDYRPRGKFLAEPWVGTSEALLCDLLAYADAMLQYYLATGRPSAFEDGLAALSATAPFQTDSGVFSLILPVQSALATQGTDLPELADNIRESASAQVVRLFHSYGRLLGPEKGRALQQVAFEVLAKLSSLAQEGGPPVGGLLAAAAGVQDDAHVLTFGPGAVVRANALAPRLPWRLVAPAVGQVAERLRGRAGGAYLVRGSLITGPLTDEQILNELGTCLDVGVTDSQNR